LLHWYTINLLNPIIMFSKSNLISTIVTAIWSFMGGYLLWGIIGDPFLQDHLGSATGLMKDTVDFMHLAIGCLIQGFIFSYIYSKWGNSSYSFGNGLNFGIWIGLFAGFGNGIIDYATSNMLDLTGTIVNGLIYVIFFAIMGALAGLIYKSTSKK